MNITKRKNHTRSRIVADTENDIFTPDFDGETDDFNYDDTENDEINPEEESSNLDDVQEDDVNIDIDNNIANHYIAECDVCHGVFISALIESDQQVEHISGICPLCEKDSDQWIKWIIKEIE